MSNDTQTVETSSPAPAAQAAPATTLLQSDPAAQGGDPSASPAQQPTQAAAPAAAPEGATPEEGKAEGAPEDYTFTAPEGTELNEAVLADFKALAKEHKLPQDVAQKFVDLGVKQAQQVTGHIQEQIASEQARWAESSQTDKEFGGDKLGENMAVAKKALDAFGSPELSKFLLDSKLGDHPEVIRAFYRVGKAISEDKLVPGGVKPPAGDSLSKMYPTMKSS